jgi:hypothetical protein
MILSGPQPAGVTTIGEMSMSTVNVNGTSLYYHEAGAGEPLLLIWKETIMNRIVSRLFIKVGLSMVLILLLTYGTLGRGSAAGTVRYAKPGGSISGTCLSWATACELRYVLSSVAVAGDQVWVMKGSYKSTAGTNRTRSFRLKNGVAIYGGFAGTEKLFRQRNPAVNVTTLSGDIGTAGNAGDNSFHVVLGSGTNNTAVLDGFSIKGGNATSQAPNDRGGGMYNYYGSPKLTNLSFSFNSAKSLGGGILNNHSSPILTNVTFESNEAYDGGGMANLSSSPALTNVTFFGNSSTNGGGMYNSASSPTLTNVTFYQNGASYGGAMNNSGSNPTIKNSILWGDGLDEIANSASTSTITQSIVKGGCPSGATCTFVINADPKLGPLQDNGGNTKTMALGTGSAALDMGNNSTCASRDQRGVTRPQGPACDLGAFEVRMLSFVSAAAYDGTVTESGKATNLGGAVNSDGISLVVGDDLGDRRYRGFLSFDTTPLPDSARLVLAKLRVKLRSSVGHTFGAQGTLVTDLVKPFFGKQPELVSSDWQAASTVSSAGGFPYDPFIEWYVTQLNSSARVNINRTGTTQFRLRFTAEYYNHAADYLSFYTGDYSIIADRPLLQVYYNP